MGKSSRHKKQNVHHFVPFSERISSVNIDVIHQIRRVDTETEGTLFGESLDKWTELDLTEHFLTFRREIVNQVQTYEQLVYHKDEIIQALKLHLQVPNSLALITLFDLVVQLAKDLQEDFVPYFYSFFEILVNLLTSHTQDVEVLEHIFQTLAYLFRVLWRFLIKDFKEVFSHFSKLLVLKQKDYIKVFAAESCAYLLRKVKKLNELLNFLFCSLKENPQLAEGIGLLLFEMVKGVKHNFHTISEKIIPLILSQLGPWNNINKQNKISRELIEKSVTIFFKECAEHTTREHSKDVWKILLETVIEVHNACMETCLPDDFKVSSSLSKHLCRLLRLVSVWLEHKCGSIINDPEYVAKTISIILQSSYSKVLGKDVLATVVNLLLSCKERLSVEAISRIVSLVFKTPFFFGDVQQCIRSLLDVPFFEKDILSGCLYKVSSEMVGVDEVKKSELLTFLAEIVIHKTQLVVTGEDISYLQLYPLDLKWTKGSNDFPLAMYIEDIIEQCLKQQFECSPVQISALWAAVLCLPHLSCNARLQDKVIALWKKLVNNLQISPTFQNDFIIVLNQLLKGFIINLQSDKSVNLPVSYDEVFKILRCCPAVPCAVQIADLYLSWPTNSNILNEDTFAKIYKLLEPNLVSPSHQLRLITCHILSLCPVEFPVIDDDLTRLCLFKTMFIAENLPSPSVQNYREKLIHLRKLEFDVAVKCLPKGIFQKAPLLFLLGNEFWNFRLLWEPLADLITTHAHGLEVKEFWDVMLHQLKRAAEESEKELTINISYLTNECQVPIVDLFKKYKKELLADDRKPDFTNYRVQLWHAMKKFPEKCVLRSDELCELYLQFLKKEFSYYDEDARVYQNIVAITNESTKEVSSVQVAEGTFELDCTHVDNEKQDAEPETHRVKRRKAAIQSLLVHLDLFATFKKQRSLFNKSDVQETFLNLLKHKHSVVQKAAFECVITYKSPHIIRYRENFYHLLDDKTFKSEIVLFRVDEESSEVKEEDRDGFLPVLMRILYGKMHGKTGNETGGKGRGNIRRSIVFGFLCGCKPVELKYFLELLFQPCMHFVTDNPVLMVKEVMNNLDLTKMIPLKKIKGILHTVSTVTLKIGHRIKDFAHSLLHILLGIAATLTAALKQRQLIIPSVVNMLKNMRPIVLARLIQFLENFKDFDLTLDEIEAMFQAVVWPQYEKLIFEGVHHPTPLLKLFLFWSKYNRFIPLLAKSNELSSITPLHSILGLLNAPTLNPTVAAAILELINNLLLSEEEREQELSPLPAPYMYIQDTDKNTFCENLLLPHVPSLLCYLQQSLEKMTSCLVVKKQGALIELKILARISTFVKSPKECAILCSLLVSFLCKSSHIQQVVEENILVSLTNMMQYVSMLDSFYRSVSQLFSSVKRRESRVLLCKLFHVICNSDDYFKSISSLIDQLNAWDKRKVEEPDFILRLQAFNQLNTKIADEEPNADLLLPVIHNCCHFIDAIDDLSIRDNSTHCLVKIIAKLAFTNSSEVQKVFNIVVEKTLVPQVKQGIRSKSEAVRHEFLTVLQSLVKHCPDHVMFTGLKDLCDKDPEADFFENIRHIQIHKRSRALRRLFKHLKDHSFRPEIHMSYFIPLVYAFVLDSSYSKHANIQDAAIDLLGAICKQLPWQYYLQLLRFYLKLLPHKVDLQKQLIRIIVTLLDAFHFDLSYSKYVLKMTPKFVDKTFIDEKDATESPEEVLVENPANTEIENDSLPMEVDLKDVGILKNEILEVKSDGNILCSTQAATRIHKTIVISLLPQLHKIITQKAKRDDEHKLVKSKYPEDEEILRVPIALAMIKLLQNLPKGTLENRLPGIILKICNFLRCRSRDVRTTARETLEKAVLSLGSHYFPFIIKEMKSILTRGYQLHILSFTTHYLLKSLVNTVIPGDLDPSLNILQDIFYSEIFGQVAEEKEVAAIKAKYFEARFIKGYDAYELLAKCISAGCIDQLVHPIKMILETTHSQHTANKVEILLRKVADGLMANKSIPLQTMMVFIHSLTATLVNETKPEILPKEDENNENNSKARRPDSCLLLSHPLLRGGMKPKTSKRTNIHILVEFGLQTTASAMRCFSWLLNFPLPSLRSNIQQVAQGMFAVLQSYAGAATAKGGNQELISVCFKAVTCLVRDVDYYQVTKDQLQVLLTYCEEDLYNYSRQSTAFNLIKAILSRKLDIPQLHEVMRKVFEMSITASAANVRLQARQVILHYLMNYPHGKMMTKHIYFFLDHLNYDLEEGRESALEMIMSMFSAFPIKTLHNHWPKFFSALSITSYNDSSLKCRKLAMVVLKYLIGKVELKCRKAMFIEVIKWIKTKNLCVRSMGYQVCGMFVEVEGGKFEFHLDEVVPLLQLHMDPSQYKENEDDKSQETAKKDICLLAVLNTTMKIFRELGIIRNAKYTKEINLIWGYVLSHLSYTHMQVRLAANQLLGIMFSAWEPREISLQQLYNKEDNLEPQIPYILEDTPDKVRNLGIALCNQLKTSNFDDTFGTQVIKNLLYVTRLTEVLNLPQDLIWLAKKVTREANIEVINNIKVTLKRNHIFKWIAAVAVTLKQEYVQYLLPVVLPVLLREMTEQSKEQELKSLALEVCDLLKKATEVEQFTAAYALSLKHRMEKKENRKRQIAAEAVTFPDVAARKKIRHNLKKKESKKRKIVEKRPLQRVKKSKLSILNMQVDSD
uniref:Uncharacterized protein n=1 Tax=Biomphalaria glabrata TaxID=6526 RepID=A0A2C9JTH6_BIOGL